MEHPQATSGVGRAGSGAATTSREGGPQTSLSTALYEAGMASPLGGDDVIVASYPAGLLGRYPHLQVADDGTLFIAVVAPQPAFPFEGIDVFKSVDGGDNWTLWSSFNPGDWFGFGDFLIAEGDENRAFIAYERAGTDRTVRVAYADLASGTPTWTVYTAMISTGVTFGQIDLETDEWGFNAYYVYLVASGDDGNGYDIWFARSTDQGTSFGTASRIAEITDNSTHYTRPQVRVGSNGYVHAVYFTFGSIDHGLHYRRAPNYAAGAWDPQQDFDTFDNGTEVTTGAFGASTTDGNVILEGDIGVVASRRYSTDYGATWNVVNSTVTYSGPDGIAFPPGEIVVGQAWFSGVGGLQLIGSVASVPDTLYPPVDMASYTTSAVYQTASIVSDPTRGDRIGAAWEHVTDGMDYIRFDAEWRRDPGYANTESGFASYYVQGGGQTPPAIAEVDGDPELEIVFATASGDIYVVNHDGTDVPGWPVNIGAAVPYDCGVAVGDLQGNFEPVIVIGDDAGVVHAYDASGSVLPGWPVDLGTGWPAYVSIGTLGPPNRRYAVALSYKNVFILNYAGFDMGPGYADIPFGIYSARAAIGEVSEDGVPDIVSVAGPNIYFHQLNNALFQGQQFAGEAFNDSPTIADIEWDGDYEVAAPTASGKIYLYDYNTGLLPGWPITVADTLLTSAAMSDVLGTQEVELAFAGRDGNVHLYYYTGSEQSGYPRVTGGTFYTGPMFHPVDIFLSNVNIGTTGSVAQSWRNVPSVPVPGWPRNLPGPVEETFAAGDIDNDGRSEIVVLGVDFLTVFDVGTAPPTDPRDSWPMLAHDAQRTGCLDCEEIVTAVGDAPSVPGAAALAIFPNPFNPSTTITYEVPQAGPVSLAIFDVAGRRVATLLAGEYRDRNRYTIRYETTLASGVYFARLVTAGGEVVRKMVVLR